jgi:DNA-binding response OmpR family regulator
LLKRSKTDDGGGPISVDGAHVLIVDDDPDAGETLTRLFRFNGYETTQATDVDAAMSALEGADPPVDLVIADLRLGGTTQGLKLLDRIRAHEDAGVARTRVVMTTDLDENRMFSWQSGVDGFLIRPFHADDLVLAAAETLGRDDDARVAYRQEQMAEPHRWASGDD